MDDVIKETANLAQLPYSNCKTKIVDLKSLDVPESASEEEYQRLYTQYTQKRDGNAASLRDAIESIKFGIAPPVAFPTETVYGLGADATSQASIAGIFAAKGRPSDNPLIVHAASAAHLERLTGEPIPEVYRELVQQFWPGPLTILFPVPRHSRFAPNVHPGQSTIGFRVPSSKYARFFIAATDRPIAGPSANSSGKPSPTTAQHVMDDLKGKINFILDGGTCDVGVESTVLDGLHDPPLILRPGGVSQAELIAHGLKFGNKFSKTAIGYKRHDSKLLDNEQYYEPDVNGAPRAPGMKYRHYAPKGRLILFSDTAVAAQRPSQVLQELISSAGKPLKIGIISCRWAPFAGLPVSTAHDNPPPILLQSPYRAVVSTATYDQDEQRRHNLILYDAHLGPDIMTLAHFLFGILRLFDDLQCDYIFAESVPLTLDQQRRQPRGKSDSIEPELDSDIRDAVADRIEKAAAERIDE